MNLRWFLRVYVDLNGLGLQTALPSDTEPYVGTIFMERQDAFKSCTEVLFT